MVDVNAAQLNESATFYDSVTLDDWQRTLIQNYTECGRRCMIDFWTTAEPEGQ